MIYKRLTYHKNISIYNYSSLGELLLEQIIKKRRLVSVTR